MKKLILILLLGYGFPAFSQDSTNTFNYNSRKGLEHYNKGVDAINTMNDSELPLDSIGEPAETQFAIALRYLEKAYAVNPKSEKILMALQGTYFSLSDMERSDRYKKELEALKKK